MPVLIRAAQPADLALVFHFIREIAIYEKLLDANFHATEERVREALFGARPCVECLLAFADDAPAGFALFYTNFSSFLALPGLHVEDLFVDPAFRQRGIGRALLAKVARIANRRGCGRVEWTVLDWNEPALNFYRDVGAPPLEDWRLCRLTGEALARFGADHV